MSQNPNKWDGIIAAILKDKNGSVEGLFDVLFSYLDRKSQFFEDFAKNDIVLRGKAQEYFEKHNKGKAEYEERVKQRNAELAERQRAKGEKQGLKEELKQIMEKIEEKKRENEEKEKREKEEREQRKKEKEEKEKAEKKEGEAEKTEGDSSVPVADADESWKKDRGDLPYKCGGVTEKYIWNQTLVDLYVTIPLPNDAKADDLNVEINEKKLHVSLKGQEDKPVLDGKWYDRISPADCIWTIETYEGTGKTLNLTIHKFPEFQGWWECVVKGEPKIDVGKVQPEDNSLEHLDEEVQIQIQKAMFDQKQKQMGLPTIEEMENQKKMEELFKKNPGLRSQFGNAPQKPGRGGRGGFPGQMGPMGH